MFRDGCVALPRVPWVCVWFVIVVFPDRTHLLFFTASYKFRSLKYFLSRGDFKPLNEGVHTNKGQISKRWYRRPAKQYESDSMMNNKVHDTNLILLVFLNLKK